MGGCSQCVQTTGHALRPLERIGLTLPFFPSLFPLASVRSLALALFSNFTQTHFFEDIAYVHDTWMHCPLRDGIGCECECKDKGPAIGEDAWYS